MWNPINTTTESLVERLSKGRRTRIYRRLGRCEFVVLCIGVLATLMHAGFFSVSAARVLELNGLTLGAMTFYSLSRAIRSAPRVSSTERWNWGLVAFPATWVIGLLLITVLTYSSGDHLFADTWPLLVMWTEIILCVIAVFGTLRFCRIVSTKTHNSAILLVGSFLMMITVGTLLLMLPVCRAVPEGQTSAHSADLDVALFTATSASCVTGLIVEPTGSYWSPAGHAVIFVLFQIGGLGILTFGAFVAVLSGRRGLQFREAKTLRDMLDSDTLRDSRTLLFTILFFTLATELAGAVSLMGLWPDLPLGQRLWYGLFHSVSAFCNAGFSLQDDGFLGMGGLWQVWGPVTLLIIMGGLGFPVVQDLWHAFRRWQRKPVTPLFSHGSVRFRMSIHSRLVVISSLALLAMGAIGFFVLESLEPENGQSFGRRCADAWFQSVTFRTAGFNTVDHGAMHPATKLLAVFLMFIGAAPGSTGGGVKTVVFAITFLNIVAVMKGRDRVELAGRCIPAEQVSRALSMIAVGLFIVMATTGLLVIFERQPEKFLDHLYEATSAFATVGVSTGITAELTLPSRLLITVVMFLGRVGPITLLLAMASNSDAHRYRYPAERVSLG
jgi:trk system potassium uptake protein TrkH